MSLNIIIKNKLAIVKMKEAGRRLALVMEEMKTVTLEGKNTFEIDALIEQKMIKIGLGTPCKGYCGYKHATCISVNDVVVHGVPRKETVLKSGDFVTIDVVGSFNGYCADMARCFFVGTINPVALKLAQVAQRALDESIALINPGVRLSDISARIQNVVEQEGFGAVRDFVGHGIGKNFHEAPEIPNFGTPGYGPILREGMTLAIEPMITEKNFQVKKLSDGWTVKTVDGGLAAHVEDTVLVTADGAEILTRL